MACLPVSVCICGCRLPVCSKRASRYNVPLSLPTNCTTRTACSPIRSYAGTQYNVISSSPKSLCSASVSAPVSCCAAGYVDVRTSNPFHETTAGVGPPKVFTCCGNNNASCCLPLSVMSTAKGHSTTSASTVICDVSSCPIKTSVAYGRSISYTRFIGLKPCSCWHCG